MGNDRLSHLAYRCVACHRVLTCLEIVATWERYEASGETSKGLCVCGGSKISPTNPTLWEELTTPRIWKLWWVKVVRPRLGW